MPNLELAVAHLKDAIKEASAEVDGPMKDEFMELIGTQLEALEKTLEVAAFYDYLR